MPASCAQRLHPRVRNSSAFESVTDTRQPPSRFVRLSTSLRCSFFIHQYCSAAFAAAIWSSFKRKTVAQLSISLEIRAGNCRCRGDHYDFAYSFCPIGKGGGILLNDAAFDLRDLCGPKQAGHRAGRPEKGVRPVGTVDWENRKSGD